MYQSNLNQVISIQKTNRHKRQIGGNDGASMARAGRYQSKRFFKCALHDVDPNLFVSLQLQLLQSRNGSKNSHAATRHDAFVHSKRELHASHPRRAPSSLSAPSRSPRQHESPRQRQQASPTVLAVSPDRSRKLSLRLELEAASRALR